MININKRLQKKRGQTLVEYVLILVVASTLSAALLQGMKEVFRAGFTELPKNASSCFSSKTARPLKGACAQ